MARLEAAAVPGAHAVGNEASEAERIVKELTAHEHWKQGEMPICEIITAKGKQLGYARNVSWRPLPKTIYGSVEDAAYRIEGK